MTSALSRHYHTSGMGQSARDMLAKFREHGGMARARGHAIEGAHAVRQSAESLLTGGVLGAVAGSISGGLDGMKLPLDAALGVAAMGAGVALAHEGVGADLRNVGAGALAIFAYRKTQELVHARYASATAHGESDPFGEDPIIAAARALG